jgi:hypothetical protein
VEQRTAVPRQAILLALFASAAAIACGHKTGFANVVVLGAGIATWLGFAAAYLMRAEGRDADRRRMDRRAAAFAALGFGVPLAVSIVLWRTPQWDGALLHSGAAAFVAALVTLFFTAIVASSMVDWYYVLPTAFGLIGSPIWLTDEEAEARGKPLGDDRRRHVAQIWVFHRGVCELLTLSALALALASGLVALGHAVSDDKTLPSAFESLGGAGIAFGIFGYLGPRLRGALDFVLSTPVGLGMWVDGHDGSGRRVSGLVVDVSVHPGIKLVDVRGRRAFVALADAHRLHPDKRPRAITSTWCATTVDEHLGRDPEREKKPWWRKPSVAPTPAADGA